MRADGTAGIDATVTARLAPAWLGPTTGGLMMLGTALFLLALLTLAWPPARAPEPHALPALPAQPTSETRDEPEETPEPESEGPEADEADEAKDEASSAEAPGEGPRTAPSESVLATLADVLAEADAETTAETTAEADSGPTAPGPEADNVTTEPKDPLLLTESELDRPAPKDVELDGDGPIELPPLPVMPAIELQFTWAPVALSEPAGDAACEPGQRRDTAGSGTAAR
ncbi:hypothetical protein [Dactylosporangium sp. NPDC048998]|uniref:hypothetical protein n=1 Tax=Dactylosporangium sp. NPDC048998 TaxID=3363976 RepID=UPI00371CE047